MKTWIGSAARKATHHCLPHPSDDTLIRCNMLTQELVHSLFDYDPETGLFICKQRRSQKPAGSIAGYKNSNGYIFLHINHKNYSAHRVAWFYVYGVWPKFLDHINRVKDDNRICNLKNVNRSENGQNREKCLNNKTGYKGVSIRKSKKGIKYVAQIKSNNKVIHLGYFDIAEQAFEAYCNAASKYHTNNNVNF